VEQVRSGDADACHRFFREYYPDIYRYLLWLAERPEAAEDLAQETFVRAWRHLEVFDGRASLRTWLHRIAHREFLRSLRSQRAQEPLEAAAEAADSRAARWTEAVELREVIRKLPAGEAEVIVLHYLQGYDCREIARIVGAPVSTVKYRLLTARSRLQRELGEGDLVYLNEPAAPGTRAAGGRQWAWLPLDQMYALETRLGGGGVGSTRCAGTRALGVGADCRTLNPHCSTPNARGEARREETMERRGFLRHAAAGAVGLMLPEAEKDVIDDRLTQKVSLAFKGAALSAVCEHLRVETGVHLAAGPSVADEKVTLFCQKQPLREVMRQLSRTFGYAWVRSGQAFRRSGVPAFGEGTDDLNAQDHRFAAVPPERRNAPYRYELVQDMRSQLLEEELRTRDRNAALLALDREMQQYRPYLDLSPEEAEERARTAGPGEKERLENLARYGWGPIQMYFRLSGGEMAALRDGQTLVFSQAPGAGREAPRGEQPLPPEIARGVLQGLRYWRVHCGEQIAVYVCDLYGIPAEKLRGGLPPADIPEVRVRVDLSISQRELGRFTFSGGPDLFSASQTSKNFDTSGPNGPWEVGVSPSVLQPDNGAVNARLTHDPALRHRVTARPEPSCRLEPYSGGLVYPREIPRPVDDAGDRVTSSDVLEALHRATGMPIVADYYTRLYKPDEVVVQDQPLLEGLCQLCDATGRRWAKDGNWIQCRSVSFYDDRLKEVPNRLLARWSAARRQHGVLGLDDLVEIAGLSDAQLDATSMAEGARADFGLVEWELARHPVLRPHLRDLARFTPEQRREAMSPTGLLFSRMSLEQQQLFLSRALRVTDPPLHSLGELEGAFLLIDYTQPGWFEWVPNCPGPWQTWLMPVGADRRAPRPRVRARTKEEVLRRLDPKLRDHLWESMHRDEPKWLPPASEAQEIYATGLNLCFVYVPGASHERPCPAPALLPRRETPAGWPGRGRRSPAG
jgi:RNA polymerase sigma-70 factor (ECF subfamily)